jgi:hypothetical protein
MTCLACGEVAIIDHTMFHAGEISATCPRCESDDNLAPTISYLKPGEYEPVV